MWKFILKMLTIVYVCNVVDERNKYKKRCDELTLTIENHRKLLSEFDYVNKYAKSIGYKGAVDFFYYLGNEHDERFLHFARFLNKVRHIRNNVAHNAAIYNIDKNFINKISACAQICNAYKDLPRNKKLYLGR